MGLNTTDGSLTMNIDTAGTPVASTLYKANIIKAWANIDQSGSQTLNDHFNVTSIADGGGAGITDVTIDRDMANTTYVVIGMTIQIGSPNQDTVALETGSSLAAGAFSIVASTNAGNIDHNPVMLLVIGDQ
jgi:diaminopimelate decarboxylase